MKTEKEIKKEMDGWDMGILIVINLDNNLNNKPVFSKISWGLVSEMGWLKGGDAELLRRLNKLERFGLLVKEVTPLFGGDEKTWSVTEKARKMFRGLK